MGRGNKKLRGGETKAGGGKTSKIHKMIAAKRKKETLTPLRETEKAVMYRITGQVVYKARMGGEVMTKEVSDNVWIPKSQLNKDGTPSLWIAQQKMAELADKRTPLNGEIHRIYHDDTVFQGQKNRQFKPKETAREAEYRKERQERYLERREANKKAGVEKAKATRAANKANPSVYAQNTQRIKQEGAKMKDYYDWLKKSKKFKREFYSKHYSAQSVDEFLKTKQ